MAYKHGQTSLAPTILTVEQARRRNAELRLELAALTTENSELEAKARMMREELTVAYRALRRQIMDLDAVRAQADQIANAAQYVSTLPEPKYGGRAGLQAAADEMKAHEDRGLKLSKTLKARPIAHGTATEYAEGCRCDACRAWNREKSAQRRLNQKRRQNTMKVAS